MHSIKEQISKTAGPTLLLLFLSMYFIFIIFVLKSEANILYINIYKLQLVLKVEETKQFNIEYVLYVLVHKSLFTLHEAKRSLVLRLIS